MKFYACSSPEGSFQCKSQFLRQTDRQTEREGERERKERPTIGPGLPIHLSDDF
jgi:hypothetical protein